jgi:hypothetical protein
LLFKRDFPYNNPVFGRTTMIKLELLFYGQ